MYIIVSVPIMSPHFLVSLKAILELYIRCSPKSMQCRYKILGELIFVYIFFQSFAKIKFINRYNSILICTI